MSLTSGLLTSGSVARRTNLPRWRLLYLIEKGDLPGPSLQVPGRRLFTAEDVERILEAFRESVRALQDGGFFPGEPLPDRGEFPLTEAQQEIFLASKLDEHACRACNEALSVELRGTLDVERLREAIDRLIAALAGAAT